MRTTVMKSWRSLVSAVAVIAVANACGSGSISGGGDKVVAGLRFVSQPTATSAAGTTFTLSVELLDAGGAKIGNADDVVSLTVNGGANLVGNTSIAAVAGVATFPGLSVTRTGTGFTISASANGVTASSSSFTVTPAAANAGQSTVTLNPTTVTAGATIAVTFTFKDQYGNPIPNKTVTLSTNLAGVTFTPSTGTTSATGTFTTNMVATGAGSATLSANVDGVAISLPTAVTVTAPVTYTIATSSSPANGGTTTGGGTFTQGASVTVGATPNSGFAFTNWSEGGTSVSTNASYQFNATASRNLVANFFQLSQGTCTVAAMTFPGVTNGTVSNAAGACVSFGVSAAFYRFTTAGTGGHSFAITSSFANPIMSVTNDPPTSNLASSSTPTEWLLPAGTYQFRVGAGSTVGTLANGTFTVTGTSTALGNTTCNRRFLLVTITLTQSLTATDCPYLDNGAPDGTLYDEYAIFSTSSCRVTLSSSAFPTWLEFRRAGGVAFAGGAGTGTPSTISGDRNPCTDDNGAPLLIVANSFNQGAAGAYTLTVTIPSPGTGPASLISGGTTTFAPYSSPWINVLDASAQVSTGRSLKSEQRR